MTRPTVVCEQLTHVYRDDEGTEVSALADLDLRVERGEAVALLGPSGVGKSTLLTLLAGLIRPTRGRIWIDGTEVTTLSERMLLRLRARDLGMVLQTPARNLLPYATAGQNVAFGQRSPRVGRRARRAEADALLERVGLAPYRNRAARLMSGGQQQRLAVAVALAGQPSVLLADEPTSQLDTVSGDAVVDLMLDAHDRHGTTLVVVTHDRHVSDRLDTTYVLHQGTLTADPPTPDPGRPR